MTTLLRVAAFAFAIAFVPCGLATELAGKVVGVLDGDTIDVLTPVKALVRVRLAGIDAPEKKQAFGNVSKQTLSDLVFSREVVVEWRKKDRYGRIVGKVLVDGIDMDLKMVTAGMAWHYKQYAKEQSATDRESYASAEDAARAKRVGLWRDKDPIPPWTFRHPSANRIKNQT